MNSALVLLSGGQDSTTCLAIALEEHENVEAIAFDYGQRHKVELEQAKRIADIAKVSLKILTLDLFTQFNSNALTKHDTVIEEPEAELPNTFVPGRNHFFISTAALYAYEKNIYNLYTGVCQADYSGYPDCREQFIKSLESTLNLAMEYQFKIHTPLMHLSKAQSIQKMQQLGKLHMLAESHTCYEGHRPACACCPACLLRLKGFNEAGIEDPLSYRTK